MQVSSIGDASNDAGPPTDPEARGLDRDDVYHLLQHERRRHVVRAFSAGDDPPTDVGTLVDLVASGERATAAEAVSEEARQRIYVDLVQAHLPKLARSGVVSYDRDAGRVAAGPTLPRLAAFLPEEVEDATVGATDTEAATGSAGVSPAAVVAMALLGGLLALATVAVGAVPLATVAAAGAGVAAGAVAALSLSGVS